MRREIETENRWSTMSYFQFQSSIAVIVRMPLITYLCLSPLSVRPDKLQQTNYCTQCVPCRLWLFLKWNHPKLVLQFRTAARHTHTRTHIQLQRQTVRVREMWKCYRKSYGQIWTEHTHAHTRETAAPQKSVLRVCVILFMFKPKWTCFAGTFFRRTHAWAWACMFV